MPSLISHVDVLFKKSRGIPQFLRSFNLHYKNSMNLINNTIAASKYHMSLLCKTERLVKHFMSCQVLWHLAPMKIVTLNAKSQKFYNITQCYIFYLTHLKPVIAGHTIVTSISIKGQLASLTIYSMFACLRRSRSSDSGKDFHQKMDVGVSMS